MTVYRFAAFGAIAGATFLGLAGAYQPAILMALQAQFWWIVSLRYEDEE